MKIYYNEIEKIFYGKLKSGFGRNLDALNDLINNGCGKLFIHYKNNEKVILYLINSKKLNQKIKNIFNKKTNNLLEIIFL